MSNDDPGLGREQGATATTCGSPLTFFAAGEVVLGEPDAEPGVVFAFGSKPSLSTAEANDLANFLIRRHKSAAFSLGVRIRRQAALNRKHLTEDEMELSPTDLEQIALFFDGMPDLVAEVASYATRSKNWRFFGPEAEEGQIAKKQAGSGEVHSPTAREERRTG
jgi:hypothetical protein